MVIIITRCNYVPLMTLTKPKTSTVHCALWAFCLGSSHSPSIRRASGLSAAHEVCFLGESGLAPRTLLPLHFLSGWNLAYSNPLFLSQKTGGPFLLLNRCLQDGSSGLSSCFWEAHAFGRAVLDPPYAGTCLCP